MKKSIVTKASSRRGLFLLILNTFVMTLFSYGSAAAQNKTPLVHIAKLRIDPTQLDAYKTALREHAETAVRTEPGVLALYAVSDKDDPTHITVFEIYADSNAYQKHLQSPHFKKYKSSTLNMVKSLELIDTVPIALEAKQK